MGQSTGAAEIWEQLAGQTEWTRIGKIVGGVSGDRSGHAVAISGDGTTVVIGAIPAENLQDAGTTAVYRYASSLAGWQKLGSDIPGVAAEAAEDRSGYSVVS
jgi:FG-GAP repeat